MTKLKCWKKTYENRGITMFESKKGENLDVEESLKGNKWEVYSRDTGKTFKKFKLKSKAMKFANKYMESNNKC